MPPGISAVRPHPKGSENEILDKFAYFCSMSQNDKDILYFVAFCLESFKNKHGISGKEASDLFDKYGVKQYLVKNYDVLHTQGMPWILEEIDEILGL